MRVHWRTVCLWLNLLAFLFLVVSLSLAYVWPEHLPTLGLSRWSAEIIILQVVSFVLLLAGFQRTLGQGWRLVSLAGAFLVLGESTAILWLSRMPV